jgi:hypothetical protein
LASALHLTAVMAGIAMVLFAVSCFCAGMMGLAILNGGPGDPRAPAVFRASQLMAVAGGTCAFLGCLAVLPYMWMQGGVSLRPFVLTEMALIGLAAAWGVTVAVMLTPSRESER